MGHIRPRTQSATAHRYKRFYAHFQPYRTAFINAIQGIPDEQERQAYGQQLVERLMFLYFLQHYGLLDGDKHYLSHHLQRMHALQPDTFYTQFLLPLFTVVGARFIAPTAQFIERDPLRGYPSPRESHSILPYGISSDKSDGGRDKSGPYDVNGGFHPSCSHDVTIADAASDEGRNELRPYDVTIADAAFIDLFTFFDTYHWRLTDEAPETEHMLSPDILGYVFEQQINQKQMGAYYTSDDVTGYIARTTIIPCLFQMLARAHPDLFSAHAPIWHCLRDTPERYIPPSLATSNYLPTETEREYTLRCQRYEHLYEKLSTGAVCAITDLVTLNLDIQRFALDALTECDSPALLLSCYTALTHMSILDPTCGTGAFLCAAANVLEALYTTCLQRLSDLAEHDTFCEEMNVVLRTVAAFPNQRYASIHTILTHNLYGVDIMEGAIEICRQRLLLMLLAHAQPGNLVSVGAGVDGWWGGDPWVALFVDAHLSYPFGENGATQGSPPHHPTSPAPTETSHLLPNLGNTIRVGNALYGGICIEEEVAFVSTEGRAPARGRPYNDTMLPQASRHLCRGVPLRAPCCCCCCLPTQHANGCPPSQHANGATPFHWHHEFPTVMECGGFDVIIGNPPYIEHNWLPSDHNLHGNTKVKRSNLYAVVLERSLTLCRAGQSYLGLLVPISLCTSERFTPLRQTIMQKTELQWLANFEIFPCRLFEGAFQRLCLLIAQCRGGRPQGYFLSDRLSEARTQFVVGRNTDFPPLHSSAPVPTEMDISPTMHVTKLQRWYTAERPHLIATMRYTRVQHSIHQHMFPKLASPIHEAILMKLSRKAQGNTLAAHLALQHTKHVVYYQEATNYWTKATCSTPFYKKNGVVQEPSHGRFLFFHDAHTAQAGMALLNSGLFYLWFATYSDGFHLAHALVKAFPTGQGLSTLAPLPLLAQHLEQDILQNAQMCTRNTKAGDDIEIAEYRMACSKPLIDEIDRVLAQYYGLDDAEYDFIISYDRKYRLGR